MKDAYALPCSFKDLGGLSASFFGASFSYGLSSSPYTVEEGRVW